MSGNIARKWAFPNFSVPLSRKKGKRFCFFLPHLRRNHCARCSSTAGASSGKLRSVSPPLPVLIFVVIVFSGGKGDGKEGQRKVKEEKKGGWSIH